MNKLNHSNKRVRKQNNFMKTIYSLTLAAVLAFGQQDVLIFKERIPPPGPGAEKTFMFINRAGW